MPRVDFCFAGQEDPIREDIDLDVVPRSGERVFLADGGGWRVVRHVEHDVFLNRVIVYLRPSDLDKNKKNGQAT